jgi:hypothetical protein
MNQIAFLIHNCIEPDVFRLIFQPRYALAMPTGYRVAIVPGA